MKSYQALSNKVQPLHELKLRVAGWKMLGKKVVFTNGCFDILHIGHLHTLTQAKDAGDKLIIGLNSDSSVRMLKGETRPVNNEEDRANMLAAFFFVDAVTIFNEETPLELIKHISPDVLVKGGDWKKDQIVGADIVENDGGKVLSIPYLEGHSTTNILKQVK